MSFFEATELSVVFAGLHAVQDLSFDMGSEEFLGLIGPNGAGKTTVLNCISGIIRPHSGSLRLNGSDLGRRKPHKIARSGVARTFQSIQHYKDFTVTEYVMLGRIVHYSQSVLAFGLGLPTALRNERRQRVVAEGYVERYGLSEVKDAVLGELPYGLQKAADIVRAIAVEPDLLLLDEPASGSNEEERAVLRTTVRALGDEGCAVILVDHDVEFVSSLCDRIMAMAAGRKLADGPSAETLADPAVVSSYLGTAAVTELTSHTEG